MSVYTSTAARKRQVKHELTLQAFTRHEDGDYSCTDIVETSFRFASKFWSRFRRNPDIAVVRVVRVDGFKIRNEQHHGYRDVVMERAS